MERLSNSPFPIRRLHPQTDSPPLPVDDDTAKKISTMTLEELHATGRLFVVDYSYQARYSVIQDRFTAACTAFFFIHPASNDLLHLAIKTNVESDLIYTPLHADQAGYRLKSCSM